MCDVIFSMGTTFDQQSRISDVFVAIFRLCAKCAPDKAFARRCVYSKRLSKYIGTRCSYLNEGFSTAEFIAL
jgi:hypothetical protein